MSNEELILPGLPALRATETGAWTVKDGALLGQAGAGTDLFLDPIGEARKLDAPMLRFTPGASFTLSAGVEVAFDRTFDAGVLVLFRDEENWAKLCFEYSPQGRPMVVSVVTRGLSDDCNCVEVEGHNVYLRVARIGRGYAFHYSLSGGLPWHMVRAFSLGDGPMEVGFLVQSPTGSGCSARFHSIQYSAEPLAELRSGA